MEKYENLSQAQKYSETILINKYTKKAKIYNGLPHCDNAPETMDIINTYGKNGIDANNCFLIRLNGCIYLAYGIDVSKYDLVKGMRSVRLYNNTDRVIAFYSINTSALIGLNVSADLARVAWNDAITKSIFSSGQTCGKTKVSEVDYEEYKSGKYGCGFLLPDEAIIPFREVYPNNFLQEDDIEYLSTEYYDIEEYLEGKLSFSSNKRITKFCYDFPDFCFSNFTINRAIGADNYLEFYKAKKPNGESDAFIGYRCNLDCSSPGYNEIYDVSQGSFHNIGYERTDGYTQITTHLIDSRSLKHIKNFVGLYDVEFENLMNRLDWKGIDAKDVYVVPMYYSRKDCVRYKIVAFSQDGRYFKDLVNLQDFSGRTKDVEAIMNLNQVLEGVEEYQDYLKDIYSEADLERIYQVFNNDISMAR